MRLDECQNIGMCTVTCPKSFFKKNQIFLLFFNKNKDLDPQLSLQTLIKMVQEYRENLPIEESL